MMKHKRSRLRTFGLTPQSTSAAEAEPFLAPVRRHKCLLHPVGSTQQLRNRPNMMVIDMPCQPGGILRRTEAVYVYARTVRLRLPRCSEARCIPQVRARGGSAGRV